MTLHINICGHGKPLVFFHGWGFNHEIWLGLAIILEKHYCLYLVDLPGFGLSSLMTWSNFKKQLLSQLPEKFTLIGWSMGGLFGMRLSIEEPARIESLITISTSPCFLESKNWPGIKAEVFDTFSEKLAKNPQEAMLFFSQLLNLNCKLSVSNGLTSGLQIIAKWDLRASLLSFKKPAFFIFGGKDPITPLKTRRQMQKIYPDFEFILFKHAGHLLFIEAQTEFISLLHKITML